MPWQHPAVADIEDLKRRLEDLRQERNENLTRMNRLLERYHELHDDEFGDGPTPLADIRDTMVMELVNLQLVALDDQGVLLTEATLTLAELRQDATEESKRARDRHIQTIVLTVVVVLLAAATLAVSI